MPDGEPALGVDDCRTIGVALVNEMALFVARPIAHLLVPAETERAEWIVTDADHVNGLLHRLKEHKTFTSRPDPPMPSRLREITDHLLSVAIENLRQVNWCWRDDGNLSASHVPTLDLSAWDVNRERFTDWTEDREMREQIARLFEMFRTYAHLWPTAIQAIPGNVGAPDYTTVTMDRAAVLVGGSAVRSLRDSRREIMDTLQTLVKRGGHEGHRDRLTSVERALSSR